MSWFTVLAGPDRAAAEGNTEMVPDCLVRRNHTDLRQPTGLEFVGMGAPRVTYGKSFAIDDGELLVAEKLEAWKLEDEVSFQAKSNPALAVRLATRKLAGAPAPELSGEDWLNVDRPPALEALRGMPVMLVLFDLRQRSFIPLVPPLLSFEATYGKQGLAVIGVYAKAPRHEVAEHLTDEGIKFPVLIDDGKTAERYVIGYSGCVLIDREGKVASVYKDSLAPPAEIEKLLETKKDAAD
jgi:hypothetical protein